MRSSAILLLLFCCLGCFGWLGEIHDTMPWRKKEIIRLKNVHPAEWKEKEKKTYARQFDLHCQKHRQRLRKTPIIKWQENDKKAFPEFYRQKREREIKTVPAAYWTGKEKNDHPVIYLTLVKNDVQKAALAVEKTIAYWQTQITKHSESVQTEQNKIDKVGKILAAGVAQLRKNRFPADFCGRRISKSELEQYMVTYHTIRKNSRSKIVELRNLLQISQEQLKQNQHLLRHKYAELESCKIYIQRLEAKEEIGNIQNIMADIKSKVAAASALSDTTTPVFEEQHRQYKGQQQGNKAVVESLMSEFK